MISPNGGERWYTNNEHQIKWNTRNLGGEVRIVLHAWNAGKPSGSADFYRWITWRTPNDGYYTWEIPADIPLGNKYKLYIRRGNAVQDHDDSNGYFTIAEKSTVTTFTGYCFRSIDEYFYQSSYLGKCVGSDRNISKQKFDNRHLHSSTTASPRHYLLQVTSNISRAEIWIDGEYRGLTPGFNIKVVRDWNTVVVKRSGYENYSTTVNAATGQHVFANLKKRISLSTTASSSRKYCYRASPVRFSQSSLAMKVAIVMGRSQFKAFSGPRIELIMLTTPDIRCSTRELYCDMPIEVAIDPFADIRVAIRMNPRT